MVCIANVVFKAIDNRYYAVIRYFFFIEPMGFDKKLAQFFLAFFVEAGGMQPFRPGQLA
jgi:hypothetical protein